ncbi:MAG: hypothetical protein ETSY1_25270 [Candidatus Entotheonella factor]|uniref:Universal stress protein n=1 Tax=Entotheonella factor TaxID=1429438 RepID=W4LGF4_ENTF1|nr:universal stress protein [Candidatus Entotheonella palauensis]ETW96775.1 MAG: hypothetical protein ETSY1_25270 [Candidatus Entotheonella factor]
MRVQYILVPVDFSPDAEQALDDAIALGQVFQARLSLLHVVSLPGFTEVNLSAYSQKLENSARQQMETYQQRVTHAGLPSETQVIHGDPYRSIVQAATDQPVDLIIMGTHGRTGIPHLLIGSVAERVVRLAPCPVLVTRCPKDQAPLQVGGVPS